MDAPGGSLGRAIFLLAVGLTGLLERFQLALMARERTRWWASSGRDLVNAAAFATMTFGLLELGFAGAVAIGIAATLLLLLVWFQAALGDRPQAWLISLAAAWGLAAPVIVAPRSVEAAFRVTLRFLFE